MVIGIGNLLPALADNEVSMSVKAPDKVQPDSSFMVTIDITEVTDTISSTFTDIGETCQRVVTPNNGFVNGQPAEDHVNVTTVAAGDTGGNSEIGILDMTEIVKTILGME